MCKTNPFYKFIYYPINDPYQIIHYQMIAKKTCIILMGPTAVGKTSLAIALARHFSTNIISADSRQCFKELNIGVAKPSEEELRTVHHYFINSYSITEKVNAALFEQYSLDKVHKIFKEKDVTIMAGGTGLYIKAFCDGMDDLPEITTGTREKIVQDYTENGLEWLQSEVRLMDPLYFAKGETKNPQRLMRALEVKLSTGKSIISFQTKQKAARDFSIIKIGLELPATELYERINHRVDVMMRQGLENEVKCLIPYSNLNALKTVGYKELFEYLDGKTSLGAAVSSIKINTRHYAKRQMTWFKKDKEIKWCAPEIEQVLERVVDKS